MRLLDPRTLKSVPRRVPRPIAPRGDVSWVATKPSRRIPRLKTHVRIRFARADDRCHRTPLGSAVTNPTLTLRQ